METWIQPFQLGFYCNDQSIMYPYKKNETVPGTAMEVYGTLAAMLLVSWQKKSAIKIIFK